MLILKGFPLHQASEVVDYKRGSKVNVKVRSYLQDLLPC